MSSPPRPDGSSRALAPSLCCGPALCCGAAPDSTQVLVPVTSALEPVLIDDHPDQDAQNQVLEHEKGAVSLEVAADGEEEGGLAGGAAPEAGYPSSAGQSAGSGQSEKGWRRALTHTSNHLDDEVRSLVTFAGKRHLLRGIRLSSVMRCGAAILGERRGSVDTYALSEQVESIDVFISHNWSVSRARKFLALSLTVNLNSAMAAAILFLIAVIVATRLGLRLVVVERLVDAGNPSMGRLQHSNSGRLLTLPVLLLVFFFAQDIRWLGGLRRPMAFLDKTCINQANETLQTEGIHKLGAFLRKSSTMVVLYTDVYLTKLWTVYEVACFLTLHSARDLIVVPPMQTTMFFGAAILFFVNHGAILLCNVYGQGASLASVVGLAIPAIVGTALFRRWAREQQVMRERMTNFDIRNCICFAEEDRPLVYQNIAQLMRAKGEVSVDGTLEDALEAFNGLVRRHLFKALCASVGPWGFGYRQFVCSSFIYWGATIDQFLLGIIANQEEWVARFRVCGCMHMAFLILSLYPALAAMMSGLCGLCLSLRSYQEWLFLGGVVALVGVCGLSVLTGTSMLFSAAYQGGVWRDAFAAGQAALLLVSTPLTVLVFTRRRHLQEEE